MAYNLLNPVQILDGADMSADITSDPVEVKLQDNVGVQLHWTGDAVGTFSIEVSMNYEEDINGNVVNAGNWIALTLSPSIVASGVADDAYIDLNQLSAMYVRIFFDRTSGSGSLDAWINAKGV